MPSTIIQRNHETLSKLEHIHLGFKGSLGVESRSRKWAVWKLQGATLGLAYRAIELQSDRKDMVAISMFVRLSFEFLHQISFFASPNTKVRAIKDWWKVYAPLNYLVKLKDIQYTKFKTPSQEYLHKKRRSLPEGIDFSIGNYSKEINTISSIWSHPSYNLTRELFETDKNNESYELYNFRDTLYVKTVVDSEVWEIIENSARSIHVGSYLFGRPISLKEIHHSTDCDAQG